MSSARRRCRASGNVHSFSTTAEQPTSSPPSKHTAAVVARQMPSSGRFKPLSVKQQQDVIDFLRSL
jgi:hypothetical protein